MKMLIERRADLDIIAKALVEYEVLDLEEMQKVLRGEKLSKLGAGAGGLGGVPLQLPGISVGLPGLSGPAGAAGKGKGPKAVGVGKGEGEKGGSGGGAKL